MVKDFNLPKWKWEASGKTFEESQQVVKFGMALILTFLEMTKKSQPIEKNPQFLEFQFEIKKRKLSIHWKQTYQNFRKIGQF